jgi:thioredoxin-like negative regulator of GroEL
LRAEKGDADYRLQSLPAIEDAIAGQFLEPFDSGHEEDSVDQRAERFIRRFYEEMRMERQESL